VRIVVHVEGAHRVRIVVHVEGARCAVHANDHVIHQTQPCSIITELQSFDTENKNNMKYPHTPDTESTEENVCCLSKECSKIDQITNRYTRQHESTFDSSIITYLLNNSSKSGAVGAKFDWSNVNWFIPAIF
jgi:hypothetical protein